jgi:DNA-binding CsgD family transcriptional regulator
MEEFNSNLKTNDFSNDIGIMKCDIYLNVGDIDKAWKISAQIDFYKPNVPLRYYCPRLIQIKLFLFKGGLEYISLAEKHIIKFELESGMFKNKIVNLQLLGLKAILFSKKNDLTRALEVLILLLKETEKERIIRLYIDLGDSMKKLILELKGSEHWNQHLDRIISGFDLNEEFIRVRKSKIQQQERIEIFQSLSATERTILEMISEGMRNKEIAHYLHYSVGTVKTYVYNIYKKIGAENRTKAVLLFNEFKNSIPSTVE